MEAHQMDQTREPSPADNDTETAIVDNDMYQEQELGNVETIEPEYDVVTVGNDIYSDVRKEVMMSHNPDDDVVLVDNDMYG